MASDWKKRIGDPVKKEDEMRTLFQNACVVANGGEVMHNAYLLVDGSVISAIGTGCWKPGNDASENETVHVDAGGCMLLPAFYNAHTHVPMTLLRNYADDMDLHTWLFTRIFPVEERLDAEAVRLGTELGLLEMLAGGTAGFTDMYYFCDETAGAVLESGMKMLLTRGLTRNDESGDFSGDERIRDTLDLHARWHGAGQGRIRVGMGPHAIYTCSEAYLRAAVEVADSMDLTLHVHVDETRTEHEDCLAKHGKTPVAYLDGIGMFRRPAIAAHCVHVTEQDLLVLSERKVTIAHNPRSNLKLASGIAPIAAARSKGIRVALGTDGASSNNSLDMWAEMGLAALLHKGATLDPLAIPAADALHMATRAGAEAMGFPDAGQLSVGMKADLLMADMTGAHWQPLHQPLSALVYSGRASDVRLTMVDGRMLYRDGEYLTLDKEKILHGVRQVVKKIFGADAPC